jgi:hypothetical protein
MILSACAESIILSADSAKQQSTIFSKKCSNDHSGRGDSGGGNRFDIGSGDNDCSDNSNCTRDGDSDNGNGDSGNNDSNCNSGSGDNDSSGKNNNQLKAAAKKAAMAVDLALVSILLAF